MGTLGMNKRGFLRSCLLVKDAGLCLPSSLRREKMPGYANKKAPAPNILNIGEKSSMVPFPFVSHASANGIGRSKKDSLFKYRKDMLTVILDREIFYKTEDFYSS
jgi:hypothetical protein